MGRSLAHGTKPKLTQSKMTCLVHPVKPISFGAGFALRDPSLVETFYTHSHRTKQVTCPQGLHSLGGGLCVCEGVCKNVPYYVCDTYRIVFSYLQSGCLAEGSQPSVEENSVQGAPVCTVTATDADAPDTDNSRITYSLEGTESGRYHSLLSVR